MILCRKKSGLTIKFAKYQLPEVAVCSCSSKQLILKVPQYSQETLKMERFAKVINRF